MFLPVQRELERAVAPHEQGHAQLVFEGPDLAADRRLGDEALGCGGTSNAATAKPGAGTQNADLAPGSATGTFVGQKVVELRAELNRLQTAIGIESEKTTKGALVAQVSKDGAADKAGIKVGDVITAAVKLGDQPTIRALTDRFARWNLASVARAVLDAVHSI